MTGRQFVRCKFRSSDARAWTYHYDGPEELFAGAVVKVPDRSGDGWQRATVAEINAPRPTEFETKAILGLVDDTDGAIASGLAEKRADLPPPSGMMTDLGDLFGPR